MEFVTSDNNPQGTNNFEVDFLINSRTIFEAQELKLRLGVSTLQSKTVYIQLMFHFLVFHLVVEDISFLWEITWF